MLAPRDIDEYLLQTERRVIRVRQHCASVLVDFDLEAPGLEHYFPVDHEQIRGREGLLDLLLAFKFSMSTSAVGDDERNAFKDLDRFLTTIYPQRDGVGGIAAFPGALRALPAGRVHPRRVDLVGPADPLRAAIRLRRAGGNRPAASR